MYLYLDEHLYSVDKMKLSYNLEQAQVQVRIVRNNPSTRSFTKTTLFVFFYENKGFNETQSTREGAENTKALRINFYFLAGKQVT